MESSFFEYRDDTTRQSESDSEIIDNSLVAEASFHRMPKSVKRNQTVFVAESEESETDDETESNEDHDEGVPDNSKSIVSRSITSRYHIGGSGDEERSPKSAADRPSLFKEDVGKSGTRRKLDDDTDLTPRNKKLIERLQRTKYTLRCLKQCAKFVEDVESPVLKEIVLNASKNHFSLHTNRWDNNRTTGRGTKVMSRAHA